VVVFAVACSDNTQPVPDSGAADVAPQDVAAGSRASAQIGPEGGSLTLDDGAELRVPAGALADPVTLTLTRTDDPIPAGYRGHSGCTASRPRG
jgi:hypothetical protein